MAINPSTAFPGRITAPNASYPYGSSKDETSPGAGDGTPYQKLRADDILGFQQALLGAAGIVPSGTADTALVSQYLEALTIIASTGGNIQRPKFSESGGNLSIGGGGWLHFGTKTQTLLVTAALSFIPGPGGSNLGSSVLGASQTHYVYIDDSAVVAAATNILTAAEFLNSTGAPVYSAVKQGWYAGNERCVFAFRTTAGSAMEVFWHDGGDYVQFDEGKVDLAKQDVDTTWITVPCTVPAFCEKAAVSVFTDDLATSGDLTTHVRTFGSASGVGHVVNRSKAGEFSGQNQIEMLLSNDQKFEIRQSGVLASESEATTNGWYFPTGM